MYIMPRSSPSIALARADHLRFLLRGLPNRKCEGGTGWDTAGTRLGHGRDTGGRTLPDQQYHLLSGLIYIWCVCVCMFDFRIYNL